MFVMIAEVIVLFAIFAIGALLLSAFGLKDWGVLPFGFVTGISIYTIFIFLQTTLNFYVHSVFPLSICLLLSSSVWLYKKKTDKNVVLPIKYLVVGGVVILLAVVAFSELNLFRYHYDSVRYLIVSSLIHSGNLEIISTNLLDKRFSSVSSIHSLAFFSENYYLRSITPLMSISVFASIVWFLQTFFHKTLNTKRLAFFSILGILLLISINAYVFHSFYLNGHLLIGLYVLVVVGCGWLIISKKPSESLNYLYAVQILCTAGLVMTRVEGFLYAALAIAPTVFSPKVPIIYRKVLVASLGAFIMIDALANVSMRLDRGIGIPGRVKALLLFGGAIVVSSKFLSLKIFAKRYELLLWLSEIVLWMAVLALFIRNQEVLTKSVYSTFNNVAVNLSPWGYSLIILTMLIAIILVFYRFKDQIILRFPITTFIPAVLIIAYLRGSGYRIAHADSLNRMLIQIVPLAVFFIVVATIYAFNRRMKS